MKHQRSEKIFKDYIKKKRRKKILKNKFKMSGSIFENKQDHWFLNKIFFSDNFHKTKNKGNRRKRKKNYALSYNPSVKDKFKLESMKQDILDWETSDNKKG